MPPKVRRSNLFAKVYKLTQAIPPGKVATYGQLACALGIKDTRIVGWALHGNKDKKVPCHRVVDKAGRLAPNYAFNGASEQRLRLKDEGVSFIDDMHVNLSKCGIIKMKTI
jgi:methylated-DNA-protein-cysteine methyltransferase-like protein